MLQAPPLQIGVRASLHLQGAYLRNKTEGLRNYWMAHAGNSMDDLYDKLKEDDTTTPSLRLSAFTAA